MDCIRDRVSRTQFRMQSALGLNWTPWGDLVTLSGPRNSLTSAVRTRSPTSRATPTSGVPAVTHVRASSFQKTGAKSPVPFPESLRRVLVVAGPGVFRGRPPARSANPAISPEVSTDSSPASAAGKGTRDAAPVPAQPPGRAPQASACEPYRDLIVDALGRGRNAMAIWQDLVDGPRLPGGLCERAALRLDRPAAARRRGPGGHHHGPGRRSTG